MADQFDHVARGLAQGMSRRKALQVLGAGVAGTLMAVAGGGSALAARPTCRGDQTRCGDGCCQKKNQFCCGDPADPERMGCCPNGTICCFDTAGNPVCCDPAVLVNAQCVNVDALVGTGCLGVA